MVHIGNVTLEVADLERAERFYSGALGLDVLARIEADDVRAIIVGAPGLGSQLELAVRDGRPEPIEPTGIWKVFVFSDDAQALYDAAVGAGAEPVDPPRLLPGFDIILGFVRDPDGYLVEIGQRVSA